MMTLSEENRRMQEMMKMYGMNGMDMGTTSTLILNANHPLVQYVVEHKDSENTSIICKQLYDLAMLAQELSDLPDHEFNKLMAVQETPLRLTDFEQFKEYPHNFDYFILIPGMNSDEALGRYQLYESGMVEMPEVWKAGIDPEAFGRKVREQDNGYFTDKGYVLLSGDEWEREKPTVKQDKEVKPSVKDFLKQAKKECAAREVLPPKADKHGPEL